MTRSRYTIIHSMITINKSFNESFSKANPSIKNNVAYSNNSSTDTRTNCRNETKYGFVKEQNKILIGWLSD